MAFHSVVESQRAHFRSGDTATFAHRRKMLNNLKQMINENHEKLTAAVFKDLRRQPNTTYTLEIGSCIVEIDYMLENLEEWMKPKQVEKTFLTMLDTPMIVKDPKGVVLIIAPWNYPVYMILLPLIPAIAAGNTVVVKPSELTPNTSTIMAELVAKYFDPRFLTVVQGGVSETTDLLKERFDHILYTGCPPVGKIIMAAASKHLTPVTLELGGKCPVVVESDADLTISAKRIAWGKWLNCGQTCLAPDYILTTPTLKPKLVDAMRKAVTGFYGSDARKSTDYSRIVNQRHFDRLSSLLDKTDGTVLFKAGERDRDDLFIPPVILDVTPTDAFMQDEIFGPILPIITVSGLDEAIEFIKSGEKPLAAYIFTKNDSKAKRFYTETSSGAVTVNDTLMHLTVDTLPFGGVGTSGMGRYRGKFGFDTFTHEKSVLKRGFFGESLAAARYPPITDEKFEKMKKLTGSRKAVPKWLRAWSGSLPILLIGVLLGYLAQITLGAISSVHQHQHSSSH